MARLKQDKNYKVKMVAFRCTDEEFNELKIKANVYAEGNVSEYVLYAAINFEVNYEDLEAPELDDMIRESALTRNSNLKL